MDTRRKETTMKANIQIETTKYGDMGGDLIRLLHILRDNQASIYAAISEEMDVNEDALDAMLKEIGVPQERY